MAKPFKRREGRPLADLIGPAIEAACRKRGFATADLIANWPDIVGDRYAETTQPDTLSWPRRREGASDGAVEPATLVVRTDGPTGLYLAHELPQVVERINMFFGWAAVGRIKIVQKPLTRKKRRAPTVPRPLDAAEQARLDGTIAGVENEKLHDALARLGRAVLSKRG
ncbi:DciA family protein [Breoghania sp. L-A4]|uniref:DUF721 domain-containing protein n=1 Tax=Breoghania sp. L-A4 TaxID=2304600 RepID=UPI000E358BEF|nr:DciA family protein [Breoghania sp. L-A4]AXS39522.1 DUF721 domain-containing protein [Breoghania sp. L-A4]